MQMFTFSELLIKLGDEKANKISKNREILNKDKLWKLGLKNTELT